MCAAFSTMLVHTNRLSDIYHRTQDEVSHQLTLLITGTIRKKVDISFIEFLKRPMSPVNLLPTALSELFAQVSTSGKITLADRYGMMAALLDGSTSEEDMRSLDRVLYALQRGRLQVVNELSAIA